MPTYSLECPVEGDGACWWTINTFAPGDRVEVPQLMGCMGAIVACGNNVLLVHDKTSGYPFAKRVMKKFFEDHGNQHYDIRMCHFEERCQEAWCKRRAPFAEILTLPMARVGSQRTLYWPEHEGAGGGAGGAGEFASVPVGIKEANPGNPAANFRYEKGDIGWRKDEMSMNCYVCAKFIKPGFLCSNKHHCRMCGNICCDSCSPKIQRGATRGVTFSNDYMGVARVCLRCVPPAPADWTD